jgi:putative inorganic carbon (HCO3(-)) transporter
MASHSRTTPGWPLLALGFALLLAGAYALGSGSEGNPDSGLALLVVGIPMVGASALFATRRPVWAVSAMLAVAAFSGTLDANFKAVPVRPLVWLLLLGLLAATAIRFLQRDRRYAVAIWPGIGALGAYLAFTALEIPFAETTFIGVHAFFVAPAMIVAFFAAAYAGWNGDTRWRIARAVVVLALCVGVYALFRLVAGPTDAEEALARRSADVGGELSLFASFGNRVELGAWSAVLVPFLFTFVLALHGRWRLIASAAFGLMLVALLGSEVRTALVGAAGGIGIALVLYQLARAFRGFQIGATAVAVAGLLAAGVVGYSVTVGSDSASSTRFEKILTPGEDYSLQRRTRKWDEALAEINANPYGQGLGTAGSTQREYSHVYRLDNRFIDNSWLQLGVQQGYPGLILFGMSLLLILYMLARSSIATTDPRSAAIGIASASALVAWVITLMTGNILETWSALLIWLLLGLATCGFVCSAGRRGLR